VLLWTGGNCDVEMLHDGQHHRWLRTSGMADLLPAGTVIESVRWHGDAMSCVWANVHGALVCDEVEGKGALLGMTDPHVTDLMQRLEREAHELSPIGKAYVQGLTLALVNYLRAQFRNKRPAQSASSTGGALTRVQCEALRAYIDDHIGRNVTVAELACTSGYSPNHFARRFKQSFGTSPHQYLIARRIDRAKQLLLDRSRPIAEVAVECGFATQAHLHAAFKRRLGLTPGRFRGT